MDCTGLHGDGSDLDFDGRHDDDDDLNCGALHGNGDALDYGGRLCSCDDGLNSDGLCGEGDEHDLHEHDLRSDSSDCGVFYLCDGQRDGALCGGDDDLKRDDHHPGSDSGVQKLVNDNRDEDFETTNDVSSCCLPQRHLWAGDGMSLQSGGRGGTIWNETVRWNGSTCWTAC